MNRDYLSALLISNTTGALTTRLSENQVNVLLSELKSGRAIPVKRISLHDGYLGLDLSLPAVKNLQVAIKNIDIGRSNLILHTQILNINPLIIKAISPIIRKHGLDIRSEGNETILDVSRQFTKKTKFLPTSVLDKLDLTNVSVNVLADQLKMLVNIDTKE